MKTHEIVKNVCVVGAGPSGLTTIKQLLDEGHQVTCFEKQDDIGGIWYRKPDPNDDAEYMKVFDSLKLTISIKLMGYSDFMVEGDRVFYSHAQYLGYLKAYAEKYNLRKFIKLSTSVISIKKQPDKSWLVTVMHDGKTEEYKFDAIAICSGPFQKPDKSSVPDLDKFTGEILHSSQYRNNKSFVGKRVCIVGLAESGADIAREVSDVASEATLSIRSYTVLLPRIFSGISATDAYTDRSHHYEAYIRSKSNSYPLKSIWGSNIITKFVFMLFAWTYSLIDIALRKIFSKKENVIPKTNILGEDYYPLKMDIECEYNTENMEVMNEWNRRCQNSNSNWGAKKIFCKNVRFVPNVVNGKLKVNDSGISKIVGKRIYFNNNEEKEFDIIVLCTGFIQNFSALGDDLAVPDNNVRNLYKHAFHKDHDGTLAFIGFIRPNTGGIPILSEMQARYFAQLCSGNVKLPANLASVIQIEKEWEDTMGSYSPRQYDLIVSQIFVLDSMAKEIGCLMPWWKLIFHPRLLVRHWMYPFNQACYRIVGPHNMKESALKEMIENKVAAERDNVRFLFLALSILPSNVHPKWLDFPVPPGKSLPKDHFMSRRT
jgi:hypothetical protein